MEQRTDKWFTDRLGNATASRFCDIMAGPKLAGWRNYKAQLTMERLTNLKEDGYNSREMQWGTDYEEVARLRYELATGNAVVETGFWKHDTLHAGASPDGLIGANGLVEIKCPNTATHLATIKSGEVPKQYYWQITGQMWITGRTWCDFVSYDPRMPENAQLFIKRVERSEEDISKLTTTVTDFLNEVESEVQFIQNYKA